MLYNCFDDVDEGFVDDYCCIVLFYYREIQRGSRSLVTYSMYFVQSRSSVI